MFQQIIEVFDTTFVWLQKRGERGRDTDLLWQDDLLMGWCRSELACSVILLCARDIDAIFLMPTTGGSLTVECWIL